jgi:hypothetical protein
VSAHNGDVKRTPWCFVVVAAAVSGVVPSACSTNINEPPQLGDCLGSGDASCKLPDQTGGGGPGGGHSEAGEVDSGIASQSACGEVSLLLSPACLACLGANEAGSNACCSSEMACSDDPGCTALVRCALPCSGNNASDCVGNCEQMPTATAESVQDYNDFGSCIASQVCPACPPFPVGTNGEL